MANSVNIIKEALVSRFDLSPLKLNSHLHSSSVWLYKTSTFRLRFIILTFHQPVHLPTMTKVRNNAATRKHADDAISIRLLMMRVHLRFLTTQSGQLRQLKIQIPDCPFSGTPEPI